MSVQIIRNSRFGLQAACYECRIVAPGAYDALTARIVEREVFSQMVDNGRRMAQAVDVPLIADADAGSGNLSWPALSRFTCEWQRRILLKSRADSILERDLVRGELLPAKSLIHAMFIFK